MMAKLPIDDPQYFWSRAEEARSMAELMSEPAPEPEPKPKPKP
jgi:hypothetical protein